MNDEQYFASLPKKRMGAGVMFFNEKGELLLVQPTYKNGWTLPGGVVEKDESPRASARREIEEELGLNIDSLRCICIDWKSTKGSFLKDEENIQFTFYGGTLTEADIKAIRLPEDELGAFQFFDTAEFPDLSLNFRKRLPHCLNAITNNTCFYLEDGEVV